MGKFIKRALKRGSVKDSREAQAFCDHHKVRTRPAKGSHTVGGGTVWPHGEFSPGVERSVTKAFRRNGWLVIPVAGILAALTYLTYLI